MLADPFAVHDPQTSRGSFTVRRRLVFRGPQALSRGPAVRNVSVRIREGVLRASRDLVSSHPMVEVGGKFVGQVRVEDDRIELEVVDYIDSGPGAHRSATFHLPDAGYQVRVFRGMESIDPTVQHLGSWHSHHPHGYRRLTPEDVKGYRESVNSGDHLPGVFLASLVVDPEGLGKARHHLFVKGDHGYLTVPGDRVRTVPGGRRFHDDPSAFGTACAPDLVAAREDGCARPWSASLEARHLIARLDRALTGHFPHLITLMRGPGEIVWRGSVHSDGCPIGFEVSLRSPTLLTVRVERCEDCLTYTVDPQNGDVLPESLPTALERLLTWSPTPDQPDQP
ncbi:MAG: hypothetical protein QG608_3388 [Actinomycetota bacterium]|nr:hypothetical protein [Actinomycetota bacterium]